MEWTNIWLKNVLKYQSDALDGSKGENRSSLLQLCQQLQFFDNSLGKVTNENRHMVQFMKAQNKQKQESTSNSASEE